ncbi:hypothetical protein N7457_009468 [Penicillium paradoxum]|uniref:uncharacterized protein n=1 Tax=Penicillium paradoxum TaxID=176176 RepID=UPI002546BE38|nr:uncharacterized protein N7457_009468 [Penicillium paradoxum]KAJ5774572.1 hypothetical protein N7457_009468 [Penicillium paradoxum]
MDTYLPEDDKNDGPGPDVSNLFPPPAKRISTGQLGRNGIIMVPIANRFQSRCRRSHTGLEKIPN